MYNGLEIDVLALGDADCAIVTNWKDSWPQRVLIDGGCGGDAESIIEFLRARGYTDLWAAVCTHKHNDHASGLIKVIQSPYITIQNGWMHDMRRHVTADALRRVCGSDSGVNAAVETTKELSAAFAQRSIAVHEPFAGARVATYPNMFVLGPSRPFYEKALREFTNIDLSSSTNNYSGMLAAAAALAGNSPRPLTGLAGFPLAGKSDYSALASIMGGTPRSSLPPLSGALARSSVQTNPKTQPFNSTSVILGATHGTCKMLLTADAGSEALSCVSADWNHLTYLGVPHHGSDGNLSQLDIERFCPTYAFISAKGDTSHPSQAIVNGLVKVGANVASTHKSGNLWFGHGAVPVRSDYVPIEYLKGAGQPDARASLLKALAGIA